jgi:hypothetical protein
MGIGTSSPTAYLDVRGAETGISVSSGAIAKIINTDATDALHLALFLGMAETTTNSFDRFLSCSSSTSGVGFGTVEYYIDGQGGTGTSLTAQHWVVLDSEGAWTPGGDLKPGMLLVSTGEPWIKRDAETAIPIVKVSSQKNDKSVFGVLSSDFSVAYDLALWKHFKYEFNIMSKHNDLDGSEYSNSSNYFKARANSGGEGQIWISNIYGDVENGDYITTSEIPGYGAKQDSDVVFNYTVAKCTENVDWDQVAETISFNGQQHKIYLATCTYHCG